MPYNFLVALWRGQGHIGPALAAAQQLRHRGHGVRFIAHQETRAAVEAAGYGFAPWRRMSSAIPVAPDGDFLRRLTISSCSVQPPPGQPIRATN